MVLGRKNARHAFLVGNGTYGAAGDLKNPPNDVLEVGRKLHQLGFVVHRHTDLGPKDMNEQFDLFLKALDADGSVDTALVYFAGHGFQDDGQNYLLSVPDSDGHLIEISLQRWITELEGHAGRRLIFLDACRSNLNVQKVAKALSRTRAVAAGYEPTLTAGLGEANYGTEILVSYSAAPGRVALDDVAGRPLSPYADALIRHIDAADLSLPVIMARVYREVSVATGGKQLPWLSLALSKPYYFRPQPLILLAGNIMAFAAFVVSLILPILYFYTAGAGAMLDAVSLHETRPALWGLAISGLLPFLALMALIYGMNRAYGRLAGREADADDDELTDADPPVLHGAIGGFLGGIMAGPVLTLPYVNAWLKDWPACTQRLWFDPTMPEVCPQPAKLLVEATVATVFIATLLGSLTQHFAGRSRTMVPRPAAITLHWVRAPVLGGVIAGLVAGPVVTMYFGSFERPFLSPETVAVAAVFSVALIAFTILNYSLDGFSWRRMARSFAGAFMATLISGLVLAALVGLLAVTGFIQATLDWAGAGFWNETAPVAVRYAYLAAAGLPYGLVFGGCLGLLMGLARVFGQPRTSGSNITWPGPD
ncbi:caspase family protein [Tabrizicola sp. WMC-M-20]|nr:caspase family protein [Tabrizicola sp. WMC-M-20]